MIQDKRILFYGFIVSFCIMIMPIPSFFFWKDIIEHVKGVFFISGFILVLIFGIPLLIDAVKSLFNKNY